MVSRKSQTSFSCSTEAVCSSSVFTFSEVFTHLSNILPDKQIWRGNVSAGLPSVTLSSASCCFACGVIRSDEAPINGFTLAKNGAIQPHVANKQDVRCRRSNELEREPMFSTSELADSSVFRSDNTDPPESKLPTGGVS